MATHVREDSVRNCCSQTRSCLSARDRQRVDAILQQEIGFVHHQEFEFLPPEELDPGRIDLYSASESDQRPGEGSAGPASPRVPSGPLLTPEGERFLFRKYNYLKFRANALRSTLDHGRRATRRVSCIKELLQQAAEVRELIANANLRLVASIARRYSRNEHDFDELFAEGTMILLRAIEKFDYARGFRFSTYATHSIQRHFFRVLKRRQRRQGRERSGVEQLHGIPERYEEPTLDEEGTTQIRRLVARWDECLSQREQRVLMARFGLGENPTSRTLLSVSKDIGLSKERVRQIQLRALQKLREFAAAEGLTVEVS